MGWTPAVAAGYQALGFDRYVPAKHDEGRLPPSLPGLRQHHQRIDVQLCQVSFRCMARSTRAPGIRERRDARSPSGGAGPAPPPARGGVRRMTIQGALGCPYS